MRRLQIEETPGGQIHLMAGARIDVIADSVENALYEALQQAGIVTTVGGQPVIHNEYTMALAISDLMGPRESVSWNGTGVVQG